MTFSPALALYICTTAVHYITTPQAECMSEQEAAAAQVSEPTGWELMQVERRNWIGEVVGIDYVLLERIENERND